MFGAGLLDKPDFVVAGILLAAALFIGAGVFALMARWQKRSMGETPAEAARSLTSFRALYEAGEISKEEYDRIRARVAGRVKAGDRPAPKAAEETLDDLPLSEPSPDDPPK